jgi:putative tryptophan/tyrosine transport system substrate-binding protein
MNRRAFLGGSLLVVGMPLTSQAQQPPRVWRIGTVLVGSPDVIHPLLPVIERSLAASGYVHGRNIVLRQQTAPPNSAEVERILRGVVPNVDLLIAGGTVGGVAAKKVTTTLPTVFLSVGDPVRVGLVASLARPGGNMTGIAFEASSETYGKRLQLLKEIVPGLRVVGVLRAAGDANVINAMESFERAAPALNVTLRTFDLNTAEDVNEAFAAMKRDGVQGVTVIAGAFTFAHSRRIAELALTHRLPSSHAFRETVIAGGLISLGPDLVEMSKQAAGLVVRILRGAHPGDIPVEQPARYEIYINLKTARALGLSIPQPLLARADQVIE